MRKCFALFLAMLIVSGLAHRVSAAPTQPKSKDSARTGSTTAEPADVAAPQLSLVVVDRGPFETWSAQVTNIGQTELRVPHDPRLLWFEVKVPGRHQRVACRLPKALQVKTPQHTTTLAPRASFSFDFDPRFYCFSKTDQTTLIAGAQVESHYGWPEKTRTQWHKGLRSRRPLRHQVKPFLLSAPAQANQPGPPINVKRVSAKGFSLSPRYQRWARTGLRKKRSGLELTVSRTSDARDASGAEVSVTLTNHGRTAVEVYFRRESLEFRIEGADASRECQRRDRFRAPDPQAFTLLKAGESRMLSTRLSEACGRDTFETPGYYLVSAVFVSHYPGHKSGLEPFTGRLVSPHAQVVRIHEAPGAYNPRPPLNPDASMTSGPPGPRPESSL